MNTTNQAPTPSRENKVPSLPAHARHAVLFVVLLWAILYLPYLGFLDLHHEEGRRALSTREMWQRGDYLILTVLDSLYLNKPPGFTWVISFFASCMGGIHEWSVRLPSALATLGGSLLILFFARRRLSLTARLAASVFYLFTFMSIEKGRLGEIESVFAVWVFASLWFWWLSQDSIYKTSAALASGFCLGAALLTKGPPALVFFYGAVIPYCCWIREPRRLISRNHAWLLLACFSVVLAWLVPLLRQIGWDQPLSVWGSQMSRKGDPERAPYYLEQLSLLLNTFFGLVPGLFFVLPLASSAVRRRLAVDRDVLAFLFCSILAPSVVFLLFPNSRARYLYPLAPFVAILSGIVADHFLREPRESSFRPLFTIFKNTASVLGIVAGIGSLIFFWNSSYPFWPFGAFFAVLGIPLSVSALRSRWTLKPIVTAGLALGVLLSLFEVYLAGMTVVRRPRLDIRQYATPLREIVPPQSTLYTLFWDEFNLFFYIPNRVSYISSWESVRPEDKDKAIWVISFSPVTALPPSRTIARETVLHYRDRKQLYVVELIAAGSSGNAGP